MELTRMIFTKHFVLQLLAWALITVAVLGVCAECAGEGGTYQGGGDSEPYHRR
jgi:hypothetical protein